MKAVKTLAILFLTTALAAGVAAAQGSAEDGHMEGHSGMATDEAMGEMMAAMDDLMADMPAASSGSVDADFLLMMIPHHQSAIDMARVELEQGADAATRAMAQAVIDAQAAEIAEMRTMLEGMGVEPPPMPAE